MRAQKLWLTATFAVGLVGLLSGCWERPPIDSVQQGYRGLGMVEMTNPRIAEAVADANRVPDDTPQAGGGPLAKDVFKNIKVLTDVDVGTFTRLMVSITGWVAPPEQGCAYCHDTNDLSADTVYAKVVARRMLEMTRHVNKEWKTHVAATGVTCYTCPRGHPVPANTWSKQPLLAGNAVMGDHFGQNAPSTAAGLTAMAVDPFTPYLATPGVVRVAATEALPKAKTLGATIQHTEWTYALMMNISQALGVNCTFCHNSRSFQQWERPQRATAWYGIRMVRDLNNNYLDPLKSVFPPARLGPEGDVLKLNCATCHNGVSKPLQGVSMLANHPELGSIAPAAAPAPAAAAAPSGTLAMVLFDVGRRDLSAAAQAGIADAARTLKESPALKVELSGFADKTGDAAQNLELAKQRAFAVRDALKAAGVADDRINLRKPEFAIGGASADARRVEINAVN